MCKTIFVVSQDPVKIQQTFAAKSCKIKHIWEGKRNSLTSTASHILQGGMGPGARGQRSVCVCVCVCVHALVFPSCIGCCQTEPFLCVPSRVLICELHEDGDSWGVEGLSAWKNSSQSSRLHLKDTDHTNYTTDSIRTSTQKSLGCLICWFPQLTPEKWKLKCSHSVLSDSLQPHGL